MHHGSCLCGRVVYRATKLVGPLVYCHCRSCRKSSGTAFGANISVPVDCFQVVSGLAELRQFESAPGKIRHFCGNCGSPVFVTVGDRPRFVRIRLGTLDSDLADSVSAHIFVGEKAPWHGIDAAAPQFPAWPDEGEVRIRGSRQDANERAR